MSPFDPTTWSPIVWGLHGFGVIYLGLFIWEYLRFEGLQKAAQEDGGEAIEAFNKAIQGFPHSGFAKMLGKRRLESGDDTATRLDHQ